MALLTKWSVRDIQAAITRAFRNDREIFAPNISWGFFKQKGMEADLLRLHDGLLDEFEIKRSREDFLADFRKPVFHADIRVTRLTYVLPEAMASDWLRDYCAEHYKEFKRAFTFWFYREADCEVISPHMTNGIPWDSSFVSQKYLTEEMTAYINAHDPQTPYYRRLFLEEERELLRLVAIRFWSREREAFGQREIERKKGEQHEKEETHTGSGTED